MGQPKMAAIRSDLDIVIARTLARDTAKNMGFGAIDQARIATAVSELARNIFRYAGEGFMRWSYIEANGHGGIEMFFEDNGPGIENIDKAMEVGYTTQNGMGMGLPGTKKLMDEMSIESSPGSGTRVRIVKWLRK